MPYKDGAEMVFGECQHVIERIRPSFLTFHTQAIRKAIFSKFGSISPTIKSSVLCYFYRHLTGDASTVNDTGEVEIEERIFQFLQMETEDPTTLTDLRHMKHPEQKDKVRGLLGGG